MDSDENGSDGNGTCVHWKRLKGMAIPYRASRNKQLIGTRAKLSRKSASAPHRCKQFYCSTKDSNVGCVRPPCPLAVGCKLCRCIDCKALLCIKSKDFVQHHLYKTGHSVGYCMGILFCFKCHDFVFESVPPGASEPSTEKLVFIGRELSDEPKLRLRGILNLGNTCFINCIIQVLVHTPRMNNLMTIEDNNNREIPRRKVLRSSDGDKSASEVPMAEVPGLLSVFKKLLEEITQDKDTPHVAPTLLLMAMYEHIPHLAGCKQQDAHEFLIAILNCLHVELIRLDDKPAKLKTNVLQEKESLIDQIFLGRLQSEVKCNVCSHSRFTLDPFLSVALEIVAARDAPNESIDVYNLLTRFTRVEYLDESVKLFCPCCNTRTISSRQLTFKVLPQVLCIQLKRFQHNPCYPDSNCLMKLKTPVKFSDTIEFSHFLSDDVDKLPEKFREVLRNPGRSTLEKYMKTKYQLYAITTHVGSFASGHYYSFIRKGSFWFKCNDANIKIVSLQEAFNTEAYLLFYRKANYNYFFE